VRCNFKGIFSSSNCPDQHQGPPSLHWSWSRFFPNPICDILMPKIKVTYSPSLCHYWRKRMDWLTDDDPELPVAATATDPLKSSTSGHKIGQLSTTKLCQSCACVSMATFILNHVFCLALLLTPHPVWLYTLLQPACVQRAG
jgi:hypothetical protein